MPSRACLSSIDQDRPGSPKKSPKSVGVVRQYAGTLDKLGTCPLGIFLAYVSPRGHALVDQWLSLLREWTDDLPRCQTARLPDDIGYQNQAELGDVAAAPGRPCRLVLQRTQG